MNIKFTNELEHGGKLAFQDVFLCRKKKIYTIVYRKATNNDVYLNWNSFAPIRMCLPDLFNSRTSKQSLNILRKFSMKTIATQNMLLSKFYKKYLKNIIKQQMNGTDNSNNNIYDNNRSSINNKSATLEKHLLLVIPYQGN